MRYDNLPEYPVQPGRPRDQRLKPQPSFGKLMGGLLAAFVALGLVVQLFTGGSGDGTRVAVKEGLLGGVVPAFELVDPSSSAVTAAEPVTAATVAASEAPGTLPPTVAPTEPSAALQPVVAAAVAPATTAVAKPATATTAKAKVTTPAAPATTAKPKATAPAAPPTSAKPKVTTVAPKPATTVPKPTPATTAKPRPTTTPAPPPPAPQGTPAQVKAMIQQMWPADSVDKALAVAWRESNYRPEVFNGSCCYGVFQINAGSHQSRLRAHGWTTQDLYDPQVNITIALEIFNEQGWGPWGG